MIKLFTISAFIIVLISEVLIKTYGTGLLAIIAMIFISIVSLIVLKKFRKYAIAIILGILLSGPFIFIRNRTLGTIYSQQFEVLKKYKSFEVLHSGWFFEYSWTHRYGFTHYALIKTHDSTMTFQNDIKSIFPNDEFRSADYVSLFQKHPEKNKFKSLIPMDRATKSDDYLYKEIRTKKKVDFALKEANFIITFVDQGYYALD